MKNKFLTIFVLLFCGSNLITAQKGIVFQPELNGRRIDLTQAPAASDSISISSFRFYISHLRLRSKGNDVWSSDAAALLLDAEHPESFSIPVKDVQQPFDEISFDLGIDSLTNVSGAMPDALDPVNGMYWTWQSGYINMKLEGTRMNADGRKRPFEYHLGGYDGVNNALQHVSIKTSSMQDLIIVDPAHLIEAAAGLKEETIMSPGPSAVALSKVAAKMFSVAKK